MYRPPHPRMMNNTFRSPRPYNHQWRANRAPSSPFPRRSNSHFGFGPANNIRNEYSEEHWCETCDRGFPTVELLHNHKQQHQKCNIDGCQFVAHPKVITKHIQMQHSTGLYKKIANLNNPEGIQKWRDERKKKYPTKSNIEKKAAEIKEKIERGEKMALKHGHGNHRCKSSDQSPGIKRKHSFDTMNQNQRMHRHNFKTNSTISINHNNSQPVKKKIPKVLPSAPTTAEKNKLKQFTGILNMEMDDQVEDTTDASDNGLFENDDYEETLQVLKKTNDEEKPVVCGALTSLMCDYESSDEEISKKDYEVLNKSSALTKQEHLEPRDDSKKVESQIVSKPVIVVKDNNESDDDGPEEVKIEKNNLEHGNTQEMITKNKEKPVQKIKVPPRNVNQQNYRLKHKIPSTLLQKLLHKEIRQERNIVLQCIRYIRINNYFDKPSQ